MMMMMRLYGAPSWWTYGCISAGVGASFGFQGLAAKFTKSNVDGLVQRRRFTGPQLRRKTKTTNQADWDASSWEWSDAGSTWSFHAALWIAKENAGAAEVLSNDVWKICWLCLAIGWASFPADAVLHQYRHDVWQPHPCLERKPVDHQQLADPQGPFETQRPPIQMELSRNRLLGTARIAIFMKTAARPSPSTQRRPHAAAWFARNQCMDLVKRGANAAVQQKSAKKKFNSAADKETAQPTTSSGSTEGNAEVAPTKLDGPSQYYKRREAPCAGTGRALAQTPKNHPTHFTALWLGGRYGRKRRLLFRAWIFGPKLKITIWEKSKPKQTSQRPLCNCGLGQPIAIITNELAKQHHGTSKNFSTSRQENFLRQWWGHHYLSTATRTVTPVWVWRAYKRRQQQHGDRPETLA